MPTKQQTWLSPAMHVIHEDMLGLRLSEIAQRMALGSGQELLQEGGNNRVSRNRCLLLGSSSSGVIGGLRNYLPEEMGDGYWDIIEVIPGIFVQITDATYSLSHRILLPPDPMLKIRVVCEGAMALNPPGLRIRSGAALLHGMCNRTAVELAIEPHFPLQMIVMHMMPDALPDLGASSGAVSGVLNKLLDPASGNVNTRHLDSSPLLLQVSRDILESRHRLPNAIRMAYVRGKALELACEVLARIQPLVSKKVGNNRFRQNDIPRLQESKRILATHLDCPPTIEQLARMIGMNRTKLKAGFKEFFGETIQQYQMRVRMEEAARLIEHSELQIAEIGRRVGYSHASNFTQSVKRHFGCAPLNLRNSTEINSR